MEINQDYIDLTEKRVEKFLNNFSNEIQFGEGK